MTTFKSLGFTLACVVLLSGCDNEQLNLGPMRTEARSVGSFDSIDMDGDGELQIVVGSPESLTLEGKEVAVHATRTEVRNGTLHIKTRRKDWIMGGGRARMAFRISLPRLTSLKLDGGNEVRLTGFNGGESRIKVQGAAHLEADGTLEELTIHMTGAGHADLSRLVTKDAKVTVDGVGSVYVNSKESLDATMNGVGAIFYTGNPHNVSTSMNGLGTISQRKPGRVAGHVEGHVKRGKNKHEWGEWGNRREQREEQPPVDPDSLQPEYDDSNRSNEIRKKLDELPMTEVI